MTQLVVFEAELVERVCPLQNFAELYRGDFSNVFDFNTFDFEFVMLGEKIFQEFRQLLGGKFLETVNRNQHAQKISLHTIEHDSDAFAVEPCSIV